MPQMKTMFADGPRRFFNKGVNGRWRDVLSGEDLALYEAKVREKLSPGLAAWLEGGRLAAGDPRQTLDTRPRLRSALAGRRRSGRLP